MLVFHELRRTASSSIVRLAVDMYIHGYVHGYIHVWISDLGHAADISMYIWYRYLIGNIINLIKLHQ